MMIYTKLNKQDGQVLTEEDLLHMEDGIYNSSVTISEHLRNHPSAEHTHEEFEILKEHIDNHPISEHTHEEFEIFKDHLENHPTMDLDNLLKDIEDLEKDIEDLEKDLEKDLGDLEKDLEDLEKDLGDLEKEFDGHDHDELEIIRDHIENHPSVDLNGIGTSFIGPNEPPNRDVIWVDTDDEEIDVTLSESEVLEEFRYSLSSMRNNINDIESILKYNLDAGYFNGIEPGVSINHFSCIAPMIEYTGEWTLEEDTKHNSGMLKSSKNHGDKFKFAFDGSGFKLYGFCSSNSGVANIYIDGEPYVVDLYSDFDAHRMCYCSRSMVEDGLHTVEVEVSDVKNFESTDYNISIDRIEIINGELAAIPSEADEGTEENPDEEEKEENPFPSSTSNKFEGTIGALKVKRGYKNDFLELPLAEGELAFCLDTDELYIGNNGIKKLLAKAGGGSGGGGGSLTGKYVELESTSGKKYRIGVNNDGDFEVWDSAVDTATEPEKSEASKFRGLIINHVYGGGKTNANKSIISHSYIELYNNTKNPMNLKGLSIQYAGNNEEWSALPLRGIVKPYHSFLIRCSQVSDPVRPQVRHVIDKYDMHWEKEISENGLKVYLCIGESPCTYTNPFNINGAGMKDEGYIDLFAVGGRNPMFTIDACESSYIHAIDINHSAHRIDFADTDEGYKDIEAIDMTVVPSAIYKPRSSKFGKWDVHYNKLALDEFIPMMVNMCYGYDAHTTRTFTWQTKQPIINYLQYRKLGSTQWITKECDNKTISHPDTDATVHSIIINGLEKGKYEYRCGTEGRWTDVYEFEVKVPSENDTIKFIQVGDQQGWNKYEYDTWDIISDLIENKEDFDFYINVGDISQNGGSRAFEWRYYYDMAKQSLYKRPHMTCVGNNDLTIDDDGKKTDPTAFTYYSTVENSEHISCYSWNYGFCHFISLNSNVFSADSDIMNDQLDWLRRDSAKPENKKRWTIVYMHEAPYTQTRSSILVPFINVFAEIGVDLVLCGHHHRYSRSKRMGALGPNGENRESSTGFYTVMGQAAGFKLAGKTPEASNNHEWMAVYNNNQIPMYIHWEITYEKIKMNCYRIEDLIPYEENVGKTPRITTFDEGFEITK